MIHSKFYTFSQYKKISGKLIVRIISNSDCQVFFEFQEVEFINRQFRLIFDKPIDLN
jgi:hypothetical protein